MRPTAQLALALARPERRRRRGRPRGRKTVAHERRQRFAARFPQHVTMRIRDGVGRVRRGATLAVLRKAIRLGGRRPDLRIVHFNLLSNHLHLIVEAPSAEGLARGMQGFAVRLARGFNRVLARRGKLFKERYHARSLRTPREVRHAMAYVLLNARHHAAAGGARLSAHWVDPYSSAAWFDGWREAIRPDEPWLKELLDEPPPTVEPSRWLLTTGWRRWGLLAFDEVPGRRLGRVP